VVCIALKATGLTLDIIIDKKGPKGIIKAQQNIYGTLVELNDKQIHQGGVIKEVFYDHKQAKSPS